MSEGLINPRVEPTVFGPASIPSTDTLFSRCYHEVLRLEEEVARLRAENARLRDEAL